jgi:hypothetical protein
MHYAAWLHNEEMIEILLNKPTQTELTPLRDSRIDPERKEGKKEDIMWHKTAYDTLFFADLYKEIPKQYAYKLRVPHASLLSLLEMPGLQKTMNDDTEVLRLFDAILQKDLEKMKEIFDSGNVNVMRFLPLIFSFFLFLFFFFSCSQFFPSYSFHSFFFPFFLFFLLKSCIIIIFLLYCSKFS